MLVIDGQQRLTTLSILLKAIHDLFSEELQEVTKSIIKTHLFFKKKPADKNHILKLQHSHIDTSAYKRVIESNDLFYTLDQITDDSSKILRCYKFFVEFLRKVSEDIRERLFNELLDDDDKILVVIDLTERDNEQAIFETM